MRLRTLLFGGAIGAAIAYFFDPVSGRGRRTRTRDQAASKMRRAREDAERRGRYLSHMAEGRLSELRSPGPDQVEVDDATLAQRVQSDVLGKADVPKDRINLEVVDAVVVLRGELDSQAEIDTVANRVRTVPGVRGVESYLHLPGQPAPNKAAALRASETTGRTGRSAG